MSETNPKKQREAIRSFMRLHSLKVYPWCVKAGVSEATLRAFLKGDTNTMQISTLNKLANVMGTTIDDILSTGELAERRGADFMQASLSVKRSKKGTAKSISPSLVYDATQIANELSKQGMIGKNKVKVIALEAAEIASAMGTGKVTRNLLLYIIETRK